MSRRITVVLDDDVADDLPLLGPGSASSRVNEAIRQAVERERARLNALAWIEAMNDELGKPSDADYAEADRILDGLGVPRDAHSSTA